LQEFIETNGLDAFYESKTIKKERRSSPGKLKPYKSIKGKIVIDNRFAEEQSYQKNNKPNNWKWDAIQPENEKHQPPPYWTSEQINSLYTITIFPIMH